MKPVPQGGDVPLDEAPLIALLFCSSLTVLAETGEVIFKTISPVLNEVRKQPIHVWEMLNRILHQCQSIGFGGRVIRASIRGENVLGRLRNRPSIRADLAPEGWAATKDEPGCEPACLAFLLLPS